ncbi:LamG domain-containing protein [uncultured Paludibaculum sp.]|uniref:LamG domain-containing protein n=1 Tax=uncultured Paludibaculum sp. TaxID=1765020 RepID=UPI002AAAA66C|nr:LamG domain-containing protein [uncultured Paludibaculum sp.]
MRAPTNIEGLVAFWAFQEPAGCERLSTGGFTYALCEMAGPVERANDGVFGPYSARLGPGQWLSASRAHIPGLDLHGAEAQVTVAAWIKRERKSSRPEECEAVAGMWLETAARRQYCLFLNLRIFGSADQVCGHVSAVGGPTPGERWCMDASIGATPVRFGEWQHVAFTYDGAYARSYLNGALDARAGRNPYAYKGGLFDAGEAGADFTVGAVHRLGEVGNFFQGQLGGLAVYGRALTPVEIAEQAMQGQLYVP